MSDRHIAFAVNNNYAKYLGATILSLLAHHPDELLVVHVFYQTLDDQLLADLDRLQERSSGLQLVWHQIVQEEFLEIPVRTEQFPLESFFRFLLPELLPMVKRVLYLDVDILVKGSLSDLFELDLNGCELGAVRESDIYAYYQWYLDGLGFSAEDDYFSSGVLLMDLEGMRQAGTAAQLLELAKAQAKDLKFPDQDILNQYYRGRVYLLPARYNYTDRRKQDEELSPDAVVIEHFNGDIKAWQGLSAIPDYLQASVQAYQAYQASYRQLLDRPLVTLFLPVTGSTRQLQACLESLAEQTYANLKIWVLVDQALATDEVVSALQLCYAPDKRFWFADLTTLPALLRAQEVGEAFGFISPETKLDQGYVSELYASLLGADVDLVVTTFVVLNHHQGVFRTYPEAFEPGTTYRTQPLLENLYQQAWLETESHRGLYGKLYRSAVLSSLGEEFDLTRLALDLYLAANRLVIGPSRRYIRHIETENDQELGAGVVDRYRELLIYRRFLQEQGCQTALFDARYPAMLLTLAAQLDEQGDQQTLTDLMQTLQAFRLEQVLRKG